VSVRSPASPAAAFAWEFRRRHRWGFLALAVYIVALAIIKLVILVRGQPVKFDSPLTFALAVVVPLSATFTYFLAVFTYGLSGDLAARQSMYPRRMFTLPVSSASLAGWPMILGSLTMVILWLVSRILVVWPADMNMPLIWPGLLAAALLAWTQALTWLPYGLPGLRLVLAVLCLSSVDVVALLALHFSASEPTMAAILVPQIPLAYIVARFAVARARRGVVPDWRSAFAWLGRFSEISWRRHGEFSSPARAQAWYEWRRHGPTLPVWVAILLPFELAVLFAAHDTPALVFAIIFVALVTPPFMAAFVAANVRKPDPNTRDAYGLTPFIATRPMSSAHLIAAKLKMTIWSTIAAWVIVLVAIPLALMLSGTWPTVVDEGRHAIHIMGLARWIVLQILMILAFVLATWKQLVQTLYIGLTGRDWIAKTSLSITLVALCALGPVLDWIISSGDAQALLWDSLRWIFALLVLAKISAAVWVVVRLFHSRLLSDDAIIVGAAGWCLMVIALYAVLAWIVDTDLFPNYLLALIAILAIPLARVSAAPLALAWNRHR